ncbi:hypothetical protein [Streptomyces virginiae]|uniref:hypothetical protein n=1 Tax=Streptomyces virginiae TaxID=1961 RepID=UPI0036C997F2
MNKMKCPTPGCEADVEIYMMSVLKVLEDGTVRLDALHLDNGTMTECGQCGNEPIDPTDYTDQIRRIAAVDAGGPKILAKIETEPARTDMIIYIDGDGNPGTEYFVDGREATSPIVHGIHEHTIDPGRSGGDHAWACSMYDSANNGGIPPEVRAKFTDAIETSGHNCKAELCDSCENCLGEPCPLITDTKEIPA